MDSSAAMVGIDETQLPLWGVRSRGLSGLITMPASIDAGVLTRGFFAIAFSNPAY